MLVEVVVLWCVLITIATTFWIDINKKSTSPDVLLKKLLLLNMYEKIVLSLSSK